MKIKIKITEGQGCGDKSCPACYKNGHSGEEARMHRTTLAHLMADVKVLPAFPRRRLELIRRN